MKKNDGIRIVYGTPNQFTEKDKITRRCLEVANKAKFPTDYEDMYAHLFGDDNIELFIVMDSEDQIYGFATCVNMSQINNTYVYGTIIHPELQSTGYSVKLLQEIVNKHGNCYLSARTHNPRVYELMSRLAYNGMIFPNILLENIPKEIWNVVSSHPAMKAADSNLIVKNAYPDEKIMQSVKKEEIQSIFSKLNPRDAQVIIVCTKEPNFGAD